MEYSAESFEIQIPFFVKEDSLGSSRLLTTFWKERYTLNIKAIKSYGHPLVLIVLSAKPNLKHDRCITVQNVHYINNISLGTKRRI